MLKIIRTSKDITNKIDNGIIFSNYMKLYKNNIIKYSDDNDPFCMTRQKENLDYELVKHCYKKGYIDCIDYIFSRLYFVIYKILLIIKSILSPKMKHWEFYNKYENAKYKFISCTKGIDRATPPRLNTCDIYDIPLEKCKNNLSFFDRINVLFMMMYYKYYSYWHVAQFYILKKYVPNICAEALVIEEGGDFVGQCIYFLLKNNVNKTLLTMSAPLITPAVKYDFDSIFVNNALSYKAISHINSNVSLKEFPPQINIRNYNAFQEHCIGYAPDIGNPILSFSKKNTMDKLFFENCYNNHLSTYLTIHPQDDSNNYTSFIENKLITKRTNVSLEEYLSNIDILVTWWSTLIFQASFCKIPVIILDLFEDGHSEIVNTFNDNLIRTVISISELNTTITEFRSS
jgi:hypothetical protein